MKSYTQLQTVKMWLITSLLSGLLFTIIVFSLLTNQTWLHQFDQILTLKIYPVGAPTQSLLFWFKCITELGSIKTIVLLTVLLSGYLIWMKKNSVMALWLIVNITIGAGGLNFIVKYLVQRPRPAMEHFVAESSWSFPSGHSMSSMIFYTSLAFILTGLTQSKTKQTMIVLVCVLLMLNIGVSRVYLGVHFPSDVLGGFSLGFAWMALAIAWLTQRIGHLS